MKKLFALLLIAALIMSLAVSAFAYEDLTPPLWQRWGYNSLEEYLADWDETEEEYAQEVADFLAARAEQDALIATYDPAKHDFTPALWEYYEYASKEEMMEAWEIDEAGYAEAVDDELFSYETRDWTDEQWDVFYAEQEAAQIQAVKEEKGLLLDLNVMVDGKALAFRPDAAPVIRNDCTMAPLGVIAQALNAEASWDNDSGKISITRGSTAMELAVGSEILSFRTEGPGDAVGGGIFYLDSLPYVEGEEVFIPVRAVAEALGYEVQWSNPYRTAVLVDVETLAAKFDADYSILNAVFAMNNALDRSKSYQSAGKLDVNVSVPALGLYSGSVTAEMVQNASAAQGTVQYDMDELIGLIAVAAGDGELPDAEELNTLTAAMDSGMEVIYDLQGMKFFLRGKLLTTAFGQEETDADAWYVMDLSEMLSGMDAAALNAFAENGITLGQMIAISAEQTGADPIYLQETLTEVAAIFEPMSDSHFTGEGNGKTLTYAPEAFDGMVITLNVTMDGGKATAVTGTVVTAADGTKLDCSFDVQPMASEMRGSIDVEDTVQIDFTLTANSREIADVDVPNAPPADAPVIDLFEMLIGGMFSDLDMDVTEEPQAA